MITVVIAEDHHLVRQGVRLLLERAGDIEVVGEASDGQEAVELVEKTSPDVAVMDIVMPRLNGNLAIRKIKTLDVPTRAVILSMYSEPALVRQALRNGANGYVLKNSVSEELLLAVRAAKRNEIFLSPAVSSVLVNEALDRLGDSEKMGVLDALSLREIEVLQLIAEGHTNAAIAREMNIAVKTVEKHRASLMRKLNVHDTAGLVRLAIKHRLVSLDN